MERRLATSQMDVDAIVTCVLVGMAIDIIAHSVLDVPDRVLAKGV